MSTLEDNANNMTDPSEKEIVQDLTEESTKESHITMENAIEAKNSKEENEENGNGEEQNISGDMNHDSNSNKVSKIEKSREENQQEENIQLQEENDKLEEKNSQKEEEKNQLEEENRQKKDIEEKENKISTGEEIKKGEEEEEENIEVKSLEDNTPQDDLKDDEVTVSVEDQSECEKVSLKDHSEVQNKVELKGNEKSSVAEETQRKRESMSEDELEIPKEDSAHRRSHSLGEVLDTTPRSKVRFTQPEKPEARVRSKTTARGRGRGRKKKTGDDKEDWEQHKKDTIRKMFSNHSQQRANEKRRLQKLEESEAAKKAAKPKVFVLSDITTKKDPSLETIKIQACFRGYICRRAYKKYLKRGFVVRELLETEKSYVGVLRNLHTVYIKPLTAAAAQKYEYNKLIITQEEIDKIFGNTLAILDIHLELLEKLQDRFDHWWVGSNIGDLFLNFASSHIIDYSQYTNNYEHALATFRKIRSDNSALKKFVEERRDLYNVKEKLIDMMIAPVQRIPRYLLLLDQILKHTPQNHSDYKKLSDALEVIREVAQTINSRKQARLMMQELSDRIIGACEPIVVPHRFMVLSSNVLEKQGSNHKARCLMLMTDVIICTTPVISKSYSYLSRQSKKTEMSFNYKWMIDLNKCEVKATTLTSETKKGYSNHGISIVHWIAIGMETFVFSFKTEAEVINWLKEIARLKEESKGTTEVIEAKPSEQLQPVLSTAGRLTRNLSLARGKKAKSPGASPIMGTKVDKNITNEQKIEARIEDLNRQMVIELNLLQGMATMKEFYERRIRGGEKLDRSEKKLLNENEAKYKAANDKISKLKSEISVSTQQLFNLKDQQSREESRRKSDSSSLISDPSVTSLVSQEDEESKRRSSSIDLR